MIENIYQKIEEQIAAGLYPGASLAFFSNGKWQEAYFGESEDGVATVPGLTYDVASVSKVLGVGTVLIKLIQDGGLELDQTLQFYYPAFQDPTVTIRQLVTHTTGIDPYIPGRDELNFAGLKAAILSITVTDDKTFHYTDINLILLGFLLEEILQEELETILQTRVFDFWGMTETSFGPVADAVPTVKGIPAGLVHDPKAKVLGTHCGSAGLFSTIKDLETFLDHYLTDDFAADLTTNLSRSKPRSIVWNIEKHDWLDHTGYTGPFIMVNRKAQKAAIFLTNRTYHYDNRPLWIAKRRELRDCIEENL